MEIDTGPSSQGDGVTRLGPNGYPVLRDGLVSIEDIVDDMRAQGFGPELDKAAAELAEAFLTPDGRDTLRSLRLKNTGMSQTKLAEAIGTQQYLVSKYENGKAKPDSDTITKLCDALKIDYNAFFAAMKATQEACADD